MDPVELFARVNGMLVQAGLQPLTDEQMRAFDLLWCDPSLSRLGFADFDALSLFSDHMMND